MSWGKNIAEGGLGASPAEEHSGAGALDTGALGRAVGPAVEGTGQSGSPCGSTCLRPNHSQLECLYMFYFITFTWSRTLPCRSGTQNTQDFKMDFSIRS